MDYKKRKIQISKIRNDCENITTDSTELKRIARKCYG